MLKRLLQILGLLIIIYALGHAYFTRKAPAVVKLALVKTQNAGFNVSVGKTRVGHYVFRPYVQISHIAITPKSPKLPNLSVFANKPTRAMLNWWRGQNITISNKDLTTCELVDKDFKLSASLMDSRITLSRVDFEPALEAFFTDKLLLNVDYGNSQALYNMRNFRLKRRSESLKTSEMHFYAENLSFSNKEQHDVDYIEGHVVYPHCINLTELRTKDLIIPRLALHWKGAKITTRGELKVSATGNRELHAEISPEQFVAALDNLKGHPNVDPQLLTAWQMALNVLAAVMPGKYVTFILSNDGVSLNGKRLISFKKPVQPPAVVPQ